MNPLVAFSLAIKGISSAWQTLKKFPWLLKVLKNWRDVERVLKAMRLFYDSAKANGGLPACEASDELIGSIRVVFEKQLVDFPEVDEQNFAEILREIQGQLTCSIEQGRRHEERRPQ